MNYAEALKTAQEVKAALAPHCERVEIAGSIRRQKMEVKDIEIVCIPKRDTQEIPGLFGPEKVTLVSLAFAQVVDGMERLKGAASGKYAQRRHASGVVIDIFMATPENWGNILLTRTGDAEFSKFFLGTLLRRYGHRSEDGAIMRGANVVAIREEKQLFDIVNLPMIAPQDRTMERLRRLGV